MIETASNSAPPEPAPFEPVASRFSATDLEQRMLELWRERDVFRRSVDERPAERLFSFFEGPPTANGNPGVHHVLARIFKDLIPRYKTMRGFRVPRKGGWDTQGLPVELEVERELGLSTKLEIEDYGIAAFNQKCKESVFRYLAEWERMTDRIGFWIDMDDAYVTYSNDYIESGWWIFKRLWDGDLVFSDYRVTPHCPRCETSLSSHEVAQGYQDDTPDPAVTVMFRLPPGLNERASAALRLDDGVETYLLAWTTTPWTLSGNTALAVLPAADYALVEAELPGGTELPGGGRGRVILAAALVDAVAGEGAQVLATLTGEALLGLRYEPLYEASEWVEPLVFVQGRTQRLKANEEAPPRRVIASEAVTTNEGTGILHVAPAFGADDYEMGRSDGLVFLQPVTSDGSVVGGPGDGLFVKDADKPIMADLRERGLLFARDTIRHTYPFCWRCNTPLLYYAKPSWYIRTTAVKEQLLDHNREIHWVPGHLRDGRFGGWLEGNVDWAVSRERYWGTPLPLWVCELCDHVECIGSYAELRERARPGTIAPEAEFDPHRPYVDAIELACGQCNGTMRRVPEVADAWFDSGAMPYAQWHYPFENEALFDERFPADFICEAVDQTRGWFYTLHALATLLHRTEDVPEGVAFRNVISLGLVLDADGQKMSKSRGNVVDPWELMDEHGADALRWYLYTAAPPGNERRFSGDLVGEAARRFISTLWNTYSFFVTYANIADFDPAATPDPGARTELDRWVRSELHRTVRRVTEALDGYEPADAARPIGEFVDQLSNWYVRRSRRRFWKSDDATDARAALHTLYECLSTVTLLIAPFTPFLAEAMYQNLAVAKRPGAADSVHLAAWPQVDETAVDDDLSDAVALVQRMVSLGRGARSAAGVKVRQPLQMAVLVPRLDREQRPLKQLEDQIADELNVKHVDVTGNADAMLSYSLRPNLPVLGPRFGADVSKIRAALGEADAAELVRRMRAGQPLHVGGFELGAADVLVSTEPIDGWAAAEDGGYTVLIETAITPELAAEGLARDLVRQLQELRREAGLDVSDRIHIAYRGDEAVHAVFAEHRGYIGDETLALSIEDGDAPAGTLTAEANLDGHAVTLALRKA